MHSHNTYKLGSRCQAGSQEGNLKEEGFEMMSVDVEDFRTWK